jgi:hypothetical protein
MFVTAILSAQDKGISREELEEMLEYVQKDAVSVDISARITGEEGQNVWNTESRRLTVSGRSVTVSLDGDNIRVVAHIIPFLNDDNSILLVAKGEVWIHSDTDEETEYYSTMKSLPVKAGESIMFFPVGVAVDVDKNVYSIEMEIRVSPYEPD